jgi:murein DD-endopeptidase MepM/ murein hydrolase activator NlpD
MKSSIVYKVGGIGPNGPGQYGPHLDIKQDTGKFFSRTSLDNYIGFDTGAGVVPVSAGVTVAGGQFGAPRSYGSHNGWDYAMPQGTKVILRNGAWVAGKVKTDYGDRITVALPDGRRFNIIHGTAV